VSKVIKQNQVKDSSCEFKYFGLYLTLIFFFNFHLYLSLMTFYLFIINTHSSQFVLLDVYMSFSIFTFVFLYKITRLKSLHIYFFKIRPTVECGLNR
jgi:hypothetical protein